MKKISKISALVLSILILNQSSITTISAYSTENSTETSSVKTVGLITLHSLSVQCVNHELAITSRTISNAEMKKIGLKNIIIQQSSNNSTWSEYVTLDDMLVNDTKHELYNYTVDVTPGYYYRVKCDHYAKEKGLFFPDEESISNTSNSVYIN
ncbi:MAG: hypothetical protein E7510_04135 [Ruminococcus sp.]|nr:hypothetical protein [Ruminococcus sp.]